MFEKIMSERNWRFDRVGASAKAGLAEPEAADGVGDGRGPAESLESRSYLGTVAESDGTIIGQWGRTAWDRARAWFGPVPAGAVGFATIVEQFALTLEAAADRAAVEKALRAVVESMLPGCRVELVSKARSADDPREPVRSSPRHRWIIDRGRSTLAVQLRSGGGARGFLCVCSEGDRSWSLPRGTIRYLCTLCTLAACALARLERPPTNRLSTDPAWQPDDEDRGLALFDDSPPGSTITAPPVLHDATFMSAILPYALGQARRHRETLTILCVSVDRLAGIRELLGRPAADLLVRNVGERAAELLRSSDIVVRLDDDRVVAILPRATSDDGLLVAEKIRADIADANCEAALVPGVTVSIGIATYPTSATTVSSLLSAADEALAQARSQGRDQCVLSRRRPGSREDPPLSRFPESSKALARD